MLLCPEGAGDIFAALHDLPTLIIDAEDAGHTVPAGAAFQGRRYAFLISDGSGACTCPGRETGNKGLHLKVLRRHQSAGHTVQVNAFAALVDMVGFRFAGYGRGRVKPCLHTQSCFQ